jgi:hypothetical protein
MPDTSTETTLPVFASRTFVDQSASPSSLLVEGTLLDISTRVVSSLPITQFPSDIDQCGGSTGDESDVCSMSSFSQMLISPTTFGNHTIAVFHVSPMIPFRTYGEYPSGNRTMRIAAQLSPLSRSRFSFLPSTSSEALQPQFFSLPRTIVVPLDWTQPFAGNGSLELYWAVARDTYTG